MRWRAMRSEDLDVVHRLSQRLHPHHPEDLAVFAERLALFPEGCRVLARGLDIGGYALSHPWQLLGFPALNTLLGELPHDPTGLHLHDIALDLPWRGQGRAKLEVARLEAMAQDLRCEGIGLVAVAGTNKFWAKLGFDWTMTTPPKPELASYGRRAEYMVKVLSRKTSRTSPRSPSSGSRRRKRAR